jgi:hypothetical protein
MKNVQEDGENVSKDGENVSPKVQFLRNEIEMEKTVLNMVVNKPFNLNVHCMRRAQAGT